MPPKSAVWIVDRIAAVRYIRPRPKYRARMNSLIKFVTPEAELNVCQVHILNDSYLDNSGATV